MKVFFYLFIIFASANVYSDPEKLNSEEISTKTQESLELSIEKIQEKLQEVRRDQLNYSIEKDLLKEAYSSNLESINIIITVVLGTFSVLAFFGIKSIGAIREEFRDELQQFREVRERSEKRLKEIESQQTQAVKRLDEIAETNSKQDTRLKVLEIIENAGSILGQSNYSHALEYIEIGLDMDKSNVRLLQQKEHCMLKLKRFQEAIDTEEKLLDLDPKNYGAGLNLCEISLLLENRSRYNELRTRFSDELSKHPYLAWAFDAIELYLDEKDEDLEKHISNLASNLHEGKKNYSQWRFDEATSILEYKSKRTITDDLFRAFYALEGKIDPKEIISLEAEKEKEKETT